ncbi:MAG: Ig-like domain-containing protein [Candidatus Thorarchaeota archaeon]
MRHHAFTLTLFAIMLISGFLGVTTHDSLPQAEIESQLKTSSDLPSGTNLSRVEWTADHNPNHGFENWTTPHVPRSIQTYRSTERYMWYADTPWPVNEGLQSMGVQARAIDSEHPSQADLHQQTPSGQENPVNLTLDFDYYIYQNHNLDYDYFYLQMRFNGFHGPTLNYYLSGIDSTISNTTSRWYSIMNQTQNEWLSFDRNITEDFFAAFGVYPNSQNNMDFKIYSETSSYTRVFIDDVNLVNGTNKIVSGSTKNGNFESIGSWWLTKSEAGDIARTDMHKEGDYALNATVASSGNGSEARFSFRPNVRLTDMNQDQFRFWWRIHDYQGSSNYTYAFIRVDTQNGTDEFSMYYMLAQGLESPVDGYSDLIRIEPTGFNTTDTWTFFNRSIWDDVTSHNQTSEVVVEEIEFRMYTSHKYSRLSVLCDDMVLESAALNDMGYEDQPNVGEEIRAWNLPSTEPYFTVTDDALNGDKAANLTIQNGDSYYGDQEGAYRPLNNETDTYLEVSWKLETFTSQVDELVQLIIEFADNKEYAYVFANGSDPTGGEGVDDYIILPNGNTIGQWFTMQRNIAEDYELLFGSAPETAIDRVNLEGYSETGGTVEILFDDVYLYNDAAPEISELSYAPTAPEVNNPVQVNVSVYDLGTDTVKLHYRVDSGDWNTIIMTDLGDTKYTGSIPGQAYNAAVEFYVSANDTSGKSTTLLNGSDYFSYAVTDTIAPEIEIVSPNEGDIVSDSVQINITANDSGSGIDRVEIYVDDTSLTNFTSEPFLYNWNTTTVSDGDYNLTVRAYDEAGNYAEIEVSVSVENEATTTSTTTTTTTETTTTTTPPPPDFTLVAAIIAATVAIVVIVILLYWRQKQS